MKTSTRVCPHITKDGHSCPRLQPCPEHSRPPNAPWTPDRNRAQQDRFRRQVLARDNHTCVRCQATTNLVAHHTRPGNHVSAGITLCEACHRIVDPHAR